MRELSIVLPTYNRLQRLKQVLAGLEKQTYPLSDFEVVVVSDGSSDGTHAYLHALKTALQVHVVIQSNQGVAAARNHGLARATGEFVLFIDDDVVPTPQLLAEHMRIHREQPGDVVVLGPMLTPPDFTMLPWVHWEQEMLVKQYEDMQAGRWQPTARQFYTGNASLARRHLVQVGGFDTTFRRAEDVELAYRLQQYGLRFVFNPEAIGYHYAERSFRSWMETPYLYGRNDVIFTRDRCQSWLLPTVLREFHKRNLLIKVLIHGCLGRTALQRGAVFWLKMLAVLGHRLGNERLTRMMYSGIFNLRYYEGVADELGGRKNFLARLAYASV